MAHNNRIRLSGTWTTGSVITPAEMEALDAAQYAAIHEGGGTWAAAAQIILGGAGMRVTGPLTADDLDGHVTAGKSLGIDVNATLSVNGVIDVLLGGVQKIEAGGLVRVLGAPGYPGKIKFEANSEITIEAFAKGKIQPDGTLYTYGLQKVETGSGASSGGRIWVTNGGRIDIDEQDGFFLRSGAIASIEGLIDLPSGGAINAHDGSTVTLQGGVTFTPSSSTIVTGAASSVATWVFGRNTSVTFQGLASHEANVTFGTQSIVLMQGVVGDSATWARSGIETWNGGASSGIVLNNSKLTINSGCTFQQHADNVRTGADIPSGDGAYRAFRPPVDGPDASTTISAESRELWRVPSLSASRTWTLANAVRPVEIRVYIEHTALLGGSTLALKKVGGASPMAVIGNAGTGPASVTLFWDGSTWIVAAKAGDVT